MTGACTVTTADQSVSDSGRFTGATRYSLAWTSDAGGNVSGHAATIKRGSLVLAKIVPATSIDAPTDRYDVTLVDADGVDVLGGLGADQAATAGAYYPLDPVLMFDASQTLDLVVANAGNVKKGTMHLWVR